MDPQENKGYEEVEDSISYTLTSHCRGPLLLLLHLISMSHTHHCASTRCVLLTMRHKHSRAGILCTAAGKSSAIKMSKNLMHEFMTRIRFYPPLSPAPEQTWTHVAIVVHIGGAKISGQMSHFHPPQLSSVTGTYNIATIIVIIFLRRDPVEVDSIDIDEGNHITHAHTHYHNQF